MVMLSYALLNNETTSQEFLAGGVGAATFGAAGSTGGAALVPPAISSIKYVSVAPLAASVKSTNLE